MHPSLNPILCSKMRRGLFALWKVWRDTFHFFFVGRCILCSAFRHCIILYHSTTAKPHKPKKNSCEIHSVQGPVLIPYRERSSFSSVWHSSLVARSICYFYVFVWYLLVPQGTTSKKGKILIISAHFSFFICFKTNSNEHVTCLLSTQKCLKIMKLYSRLESVGWNAVHFCVFVIV